MYYRKFLELYPKVHRFQTLLAAKESLGRLNPQLRVKVTDKLSLLDINITSEHIYRCVLIEIEELENELKEAGIETSERQPT
jgi:hypothetical protein